MMAPSHLFYGYRWLDKFRYLQLKLSHQCLIIHWSYELLPETLAYFLVKFYV
jgi:hypothetical protein